MPPQFLTGAIFALVLLALGILFGLWLARRKPPVLNAAELEPALLNLMRFTNNFSRDFSEFRSVIATANDQARELNTLAERPTSQASSQLLAEIMAANEHLQQRLMEAETSLQSQAEKLNLYMTEARTDTLTGIANRRSFSEEIGRRFAMFRRQAIRAGVMLLDVDRFKAVNDRYGHAVGDAVLKGIAEALRRAVRESDLLARFGGEEFVVVLAGNTPAEFCLAAERLRRTVESTEVKCDGLTLHPTVSCGVTEFLVGDEECDVLRRADEALYAAKSDGRNCAFWRNGEAATRISLGELPPAVRATDDGEKFRELCSELRRKLLEITHSG